MQLQRKPTARECARELMMKRQHGEPETMQPAKKPNHYPTDEQMEIIFNAWTKDGAKGIEEVLRNMYPPTKAGTELKK